jgi:hypothetical protein
VTRSRRQGGAWTVGCVGVAVRALTSITAQLTARFIDDPSDVASSVLTGFLAALASADLDRAPGHAAAEIGGLPLRLGRRRVLPPACWSLRVTAT